MKFSISHFVTLATAFLFCACSGLESNVFENRIPLETPEIISPQAGTNIRPQKDNTYAITVKSTDIVGAEKYIFSLLNTSGITIQTKKSETPETTFSSLRKGSIFGVKVAAVNATERKESKLVSFSTLNTPGNLNTNTIKDQSYNSDSRLFSATVYDENAKDSNLYYSLYFSPIFNLAQIQEVIVEKAQVKNGDKINITLGARRGKYRLVIYDKDGYRISTHVFEIK